MAYTPIHPFNDDNVPDEDDLEYCYHLTMSLEFYSPAQLISKARNAGVLTPLLNHENCAYLLPYYDLMMEAEDLIRIHHKHKFASLLDNNQQNEILHEILPLVFHDICRYCSVSCAAAFFESPLHHRVNLHDQFVNYYAPLEYAALHLSSAMTQIFLHHGASPSNYRCYFRGYPLQTALTQLRLSNNYVKQWTKEKSLFKLFYVLCFPELREPLDTIRLLASHTKPLEDFLDNYIVFGRISELIVLVMAARDDLLVPSTDGGSFETTWIGQYFAKGTSSNKLVKLLSKSALNKKLMDAKVKVETLWRAIHVLDRFRNSPSLQSVPKNDVPFHIAIDLMNDAGFEELKPEDVLCNDMECMRPNFSTSIAIEYSKRIGLDKHSFGSGLHPLVRVRKAAPSSGFSSVSKSSSQHHEYHTFPAWNSDMLKPVETRLSKAAPMKPALHPVLASARKFAPLLWIAKKSFK